jgi:hypothetical protein
MIRSMNVVPAAALLAALCAAPALAQSQSATVQATLTTADGTPVTVTDHPGNSISPDYHVDFEAMDANHDGRIVRAEARGNADLMREFHVVDANHDGRLTRAEMKGWID